MFVPMSMFTDTTHTHLHDQLLSAPVTPFLVLPMNEEILTRNEY
jgi:hypothetical protein